MKICSKCLQTLPTINFSKCSSFKDGLQYACKDCQKIIERTRIRERTSDYTHECYRREKINNPERFLLNRVKQRAKKRNLEFNLEIADIIIPEVCPILGIPLVNHAPVKGNQEGYRENSPSVDRIDSTKGYIKGNILICSAKANVIKSYGTLEDHQKIVEFLEKYADKNSCS